MAAAAAAVPSEPIDFTILHFNDVYEVEEGRVEPLAGAARFQTALKHYASENPLILFSGDVFSPSESTELYQGFVVLRHGKLLMSMCAYSVNCHGRKTHGSFSEQVWHPLFRVWQS
jgi:hypothetical protein